MADRSRAAGRGSCAGLSPLVAGGLVLGVLGLSATIGRRNAPDASHPAIRRWYKRLDKPFFTPPDAVFGVAWPVLEAGLAVGGYRLLRRPSSGARDVALGLWLLDTAMIGGWTWIFFRKRALGGSVIASAAMLATAGAYAATAGKVDRVARATALPFVAWLGFATMLAERIRARNVASAAAPPARLTVWHDGGCPLCRREIALMRRLDRRGAITFVDASDGETACPRDRAELLARFHARENGQMLSGAAAFAAMWRRIPLLRPLGLAAHNQVVLAALELAYRGFLRARPALQGIAGRFDRA